MKCIKWTVFLVSGLTLSACGPAMKSASTNGSLTCNPGATCPGQLVVDPVTEDLWKTVDLSGAVSGGPYFEANAIGLDRGSQSIDLKLPLPQNPFGQEFTADIPELPGAKIGLVQDASGHWSVALRVPLKYLIKGVDVGVPGKLPNGDELPGIPGGEKPIYALDVHRLGRTITVYIGLQAAAVFVPTPEFNPYVALGFPIRNQSQRQVVGYFSTVPKKTTFAGGFYMAAVIPDSVARVLEKILIY
ncbi:MAG: hypothetical protein K2X47_15960 [Bdellovibrionales bacterium]|nr:hypothetical protein [Bdellovibrionales bacterium]